MNRFMSALAVLTLVSASQAAATTIEPGHSAVWYDPARDGEGWMLEIHADDRALMAWYTYDEDGGQRWLSADGVIVRDADDGDRIEFPGLYVTRGGRFGPDFDPAQVEREIVGSAVIRFDDCERGSIDYEAFDQAGTIDLYRLSHTMAAGCRPIHGMTGEPVFSYAGQSGAWFDPAHDGEGWFLQWMAHNEAIITWYTYDGEGNQAWLLGTGTLDEDGTLVFEHLHGARGARFGDAFDPDDVERFDWGRLELAIDCDAGTARYESQLPDFGAGEYGDVLHLSRLARPAACPWVAPKLTDLYEFSLTRLNIERENPHTREVNTIVRDLADDGTVIGHGPMFPGSEQGGVLRLQPGEVVWQHLPDDDRIDLPLSVSPDAGIIVSSRVFYDEEGMLTWIPVQWNDDAMEWQPLPGMLVDDYRSFIVNNVSPDRSRVTGRSTLDSGGEHPWIWDAENGQVILPLSEEIRGGSPTMASDDGRIVFGATIRTPYGGGFARRGAIRWVDGQSPESLLDGQGAELGLAAVTDSAGRVVFGFDHVLIDDGHPSSRQAWYWISPEQQAYLGTFEDAWTSNLRPWWIGDVTHDGSMAVGNYTTGPGTGEGFVWTQDTGLTSLREILEHADLLDELERTGPWDERAATRISSTGDMILLEGRTWNPTLISHGAILHLTPRAPDGDPP